MRLTVPELKKQVKCVWEDAIENIQAKGKFKRALRVFGQSDARCLIESLLNAPPEAQDEWLKFYEQWAASEVDRLLGELASLDDFIRKAAWEKAREHARRNSRDRMQRLQSEIVVHVRQAGGTIDYLPAQLAKTLSRTKRSLAVTRIERAMHGLCVTRQARKIRPPRGEVPRFVLLTAEPNKTDRQNRYKH